VIDFVLDGGYAMWGVIVCGVAMLVMTVRGFRPGRRHAVDAVLVWAGAALALGLIGTLIGITQAAAAIRASGGADPVLVWEGVRIVLSTTFVGVCLFLIGLVSWGVLRARVLRSAEN
jgi:hypothetical protein